MIVFYNYYAFRKCTGFWGFLSKRQHKSMISKHCQSTYHDTLNKIDRLMKLFLRNIWIRSNSLDLTSLNDRAVEQNKVIVIIIF